jgi:hypothetical protein
MADARQVPVKAVPDLATPEDYVATFEGFKPGTKVLQDLCARFHDRNTYCTGGVEGQRETERRAAQKEVVTWILRRMGQIKGDENA